MRKCYHVVMAHDIFRMIHSNWQQQQRELRYSGRLIMEPHHTDLVLYRTMGLLGPSTWKQPMLCSSGRRPGDTPLPPRVLTRQASSRSLKAASGRAGGLLMPGTCPGPAQTNQMLRPLQGCLDINRLRKDLEGFRCDRLTSRLVS